MKLIGSSITHRCVLLPSLLHCCFDFDGFLMILRYGLDSDCFFFFFYYCLFGKGTSSPSPFFMFFISFCSCQPTRSCQWFYIHLCLRLSVLLSIIVLTLSRLRSTSACLSVAGNRRVFFLTSQLKPGVSPQFPLLKKEPSTFSIYLSYAAHRLRAQGEVFTAGGSGSHRSTSQHCSDFHFLSGTPHLQHQRGSGRSGAVGSTG